MARAIAETRAFSPGEAGRLAAELGRRVSGEVRFDQGSRALYATDASNYRQIPIGVVLPRGEADVVETMAVCRRFGAPVLARGCGTSLAGQCCNVAVTIDLSKYMGRVLAIDPARRRARVEAGTVLDTLRDAAEPLGLTFGPDPATHNRCTLGGMIGNNSCGVHSMMAEFYGPGPRMSDNVEALDILTYDGLRLRVGPTPPEELARLAGEPGRRGEIYRRLRALVDRYAPLIRERVPRIARRVSGFNLDELLPEQGFNVARALVGSEGTCATVLTAELTLVPEAGGRTLVVLGYPDVFRAADHVPRVREARPIGLEGLDDRLVGYMRQKELHPEYLALLPEGAGWLLVELGGDTARESHERARALVDSLRGPDGPAARILDDPTDAAHMWKIRESGLGATAFVPGSPDTWTGWEDSAVPTERLGDYLRGLRALFERYDYDAALYGHFGQGCVHTRIPFDLVTREGLRKYRAFVDEAADLVLQHGGSLSGEHGDGQARGELLPKMFGPELVGAFREFKRIWDPDWKMNPGKVVDPDPILANLRLGADYRPAPVRTHFAYAHDEGSFARATLRCVGVGECRKTDGGTMCPSYMATREEMHTTRGRAHLLFEMLQGDAVSKGWRDEHVRESLDLCLSCKGCKHECPVNVDLATYKAEFLAHYYEGRWRPPFAYATGLIHRWARLAAVAPALANTAVQAPGLGALAKRLVGVAPERDLPAFAPETFQHWFHHRRRRKPEGTRVIVWPDTFNNYFYPAVGRAAVEVLERLGFRVSVPAARLCCGRPLYDHGMLVQARRQLREILHVMQPAIAAGVPIVVLEPSCASVFRDELQNLFPDDDGARRLGRQVRTFGEFLAGQEDLSLPRLDRRVLLHGHCHQEALIGLEGERRVLSDLGVELDVPDTGCCGLAGAFGYEHDHYDVSMKIGERVLLPAVRAASLSTLVVADGFSCREQIAHATSRRALHLAQVAAMAWDGAGRTAHLYPERQAAPDRREPAGVGVSRGVLTATGLALGAALLGAFVFRQTRA